MVAGWLGRQVWSSDTSDAHTEKADGAKNHESDEAGGDHRRRGLRVGVIQRWGMQVRTPAEELAREAVGS